MECPMCDGKGKYKNVFGKVDGCYYCLGTGEVNDKSEQVKTEQEYIQTCNTEQLAEFLFRIAYMCSYCGDEAHSSQEKMQQCHFGKCGCQRKDWEMWLKQPHNSPK